MSYSYSIQAATKAEAKEKIVAEWDKIVASQPIHSSDRQAAQAAAAASVDVLREPSDSEQISVGGYGSVAYRDSDISSMGLTINAAVVPK